MALGMEVGLGPGNIVLDGDPAPLPKNGAVSSELASVMEFGFKENETVQIGEYTAMQDTALAEPGNTYETQLDTVQQVHTSVKAKFNYASWFEAGSNQLRTSWRNGIWLLSNKVSTCSVLDAIQTHNDNNAYEKHLIYQ